MNIETNKAKIEKQAKLILDKFASALEKVEKEKTEIEGYVNREEFEREEGDGKECGGDFREKFLDNAPHHDEDFVIAEKKRWK